MNFIDSGVTFKDILNAGFFTGGPKIAKGKYKKDANNNITGNMPVINAIDIDWNKAEIPGIDDPLTSTGQLLALIGLLNEKVDNFEHQQIPSNIEEQIEALNNRIDEYHLDYLFEYDLLNVVKSSGPTSMKKTDTVNIVFSASTGYILPNDITVNGATYSYNKNNGMVTISNPVKKNISIIIHTNELRQCTFNIPTLSRMTCELVDSTKTVFTVGETFDIKLTLTGDSDLWALPDNISGTKCTVTPYNSTTGIATLRCDGSGDMTINASTKDVAVYRFAVALETNSIFTTGNDTITNMTAGTNGANIAALQGALSATGTCPVNFANGFNAPSSVNVEGTYVWFIIPSKFFQESTFNFINGSNKYVLKQSNIQDLTVDTKIKNCVTIPAGNGNKIQYTLVCVSNNGLGGKQEFKKL